MALKPTPTKLVLLMSAAGLGLSLPGLALASRDNAQSSYAPSFGASPRSEQDCSSKGLDALASCPHPGGELLRTMVTEATVLSLLLSPVDRSTDLKVPPRALAADATRHPRQPHEARSGNDGPQRDDGAPRPEAPVAAQITDASNRDPEFKALALVLLENPPEAVDSAAESSALTDRPLATAPRTLGQTTARDADADFELPIGQGKLGAAQALAVDARSAPDTELPDGSLELAFVAKGIAVPATQSASRGGEATSAIDDDEARSPEVAAFRPDDRSAMRAKFGASADPTPSASLESVWASLAEVLGSQLEESSPPIAASQGPAAAQRGNGAIHAVAAVAVDPVADFSAPLSGLPGNDSNSLWRSSKADDIVVASSHSDKILLSLAALRSGEGRQMGSSGAPIKTTIVVRHTDKVLETLALFQPRSSKRADFACTQKEEGTRSSTPVASLGAWDTMEQADPSANIAFAKEVDILLDVSPPVADRSVAPVLQAAPAHPVPSEVPAANRRAMGRDMVALSSDKLDEVRGGFVTETGLKVSFGIERAVYLNGNLVTTTSLNIADLSKITGGQAQVTGTGSGSLALVQSGAGNIFSPATISSTAAGTVIQNTLDNQKINTVTRIDAVVNSAGIMRSINLQSSMRSAIVDSLRR